MQAKSLGFEEQPLNNASSPLQYRFKEFSNLNPVQIWAFTFS
jgi:hypothetical protein